jgi:hypothetical protein
MQNPFTSEDLEKLILILGGGSRLVQQLKGKKGFISLDPLVFAPEILLTFRDLPADYQNDEIIKFREELLGLLHELGVQIIPWFESFNSLGKVRKEIFAVIDVERKEPTVRILEDKLNTQVITLMDLDPEYLKSSTSYVDKIRIGTNALISTWSVMVIGLNRECVGITNMNLSDSLFERKHLKEFIVHTLLPKIYAPIKPIRIEEVITSHYDPEQNSYADQLIDMGRSLVNTNIFPPGSKILDLIADQKKRRMVADILDGRTGVSYGFLCIAEKPSVSIYDLITQKEWDELNPIPDVNGDLLRQNEDGNWYAEISGEYRRMPEVWVVSSRSGSDKSNLSLSDVVRIGLVNGKIYMQVPTSRNIEEIRPSFDSYAMFAQALSAMFFKPDLIQENGMPVVHFHGYPRPEFFKDTEGYIGAGNICLPCGTVPAAILNYEAVQDLARQVKNDAETLICIVEPDHGVNFLSNGRVYLQNRIKEGIASKQIELGGKYFPALRGE